MTMNAQTNSTLSNLPYVEELSDRELEAVSGGLLGPLVTAVVGVEDSVKDIGNESLDDNAIANCNYILNDSVNDNKIRVL